VKLRLSIDVGDGPEEVEAGPAAIIMWERATKRRMSDLGDGVAMEDLARLAWEQLRIEKRTAEKFDDWIRNLLDLDEATADPLAHGREAPLAG